MNNLNIDLFYFVGYIDADFLETFLIGIGGKRSQYLPQEIKITQPVYDEKKASLAQQESYNLRFQYEMNGEYITKVTVLNDKDETDKMFEILYKE